MSYRIARVLSQIRISVHVLFHYVSISLDPEDVKADDDISDNTHQTKNLITSFQGTHKCHRNTTQV